MKSRTLAYPHALSRTASSMITGRQTSRSPQPKGERRRRQKRSGVRDFDSPRPHTLRAVNAAATQRCGPLRKQGESSRSRRNSSSVRAMASTPCPSRTSSANLTRPPRTARRRPSLERCRCSARRGQRRSKPPVVNRASIWKLADVATEAVQAEASNQPESRNTRRTPTERVVRNYDDDRLRIFFPGKPSDAQRTTLKSRGFKWSPANGVAATEHAGRGVCSGRHFARIRQGTPRCIGPNPATAPAIDATTPRTKVVAGRRRASPPKPSRSPRPRSSMRSRRRRTPVNQHPNPSSPPR